MSDIKIYECGLRIGNEYKQFCESRCEIDVDEYIEIMKATTDRGEIVKYEKDYRLVSTTPRLISRN